MQLLIFLLFFTIFINFVYTNETVTVTKIRLRLQNGQLLIGNRKIQSNQQRIVYEFLGIPFAEKPLEEKRFEFPYRLGNILPTQVYDATQQKPSCTQVPDLTFNRTFHGAEIWNPPDETSEDCLYMNIWVPVRAEYDRFFKAESDKISINDVQYVDIPTKFPTHDKLTTLFWIYGGSFISGTINLQVYDGTIMAAHENIIVVGSNYRVGAFGFLYLNDSRMPGNAGLYDQVLALEWYHKHYEGLFNSRGVCLFGESAGAISIHLHMLNLNDDTKDLFNCAIVESGTAYLDIAFRKAEDAYELTESLAEISKCPGGKSKEAMIKCLKGLDAQTLLNNQFQIDFVNRYLPMPFIPTQDYYNYVQAAPFHTKTTTAGLLTRYNKLKNFKFLLGINNDEGSFFLFYAYYMKYFNLTHLYPLSQDTDREKFVIDVLAELLVTKTYDSSDLDSFSKCLNKVYGNKPDFLDPYCEINVWDKVSKIIGDIVFSCPTIQLFDNLRSIRPKNSFFYRFGYRSPVNPWPSWMGISHGNEIEFVFGVPYMNKALYTDNDRYMSKLVMNYWSNFAKYGNLTSSYVDTSDVTNFIEIQLNSTTRKTYNTDYDRFRNDYRHCKLHNYYLFENYQKMPKSRICEDYKELVLNRSTRSTGRILLYSFWCIFLTIWK